MSKRPTLYDVAALAGVSHQTVSRLVKGHTNIGPELRTRVELAIATLDYRPNMVARSLATSRSNRIGCLFFDRFDEVGPTRIAQAASDRAREAGYFLDIVAMDPRDSDEIQRAMSLIHSGGLAGVMVFAPTSRVVDAMQSMTIPVPYSVEIDTINPLANGELSVSNLGTRLLVQHLVSLGHSRFFTITGPLDWFAAATRLEAYRSEIERTGVSAVGHLEGDWGAQSGYDLAKRMPLDAGVTALVVANYQMALGAMRALSERGVRVPDQMSVVGFDDIPEAKFFTPSLTTLRLDFEREGRLAMDRLINMIDGEWPVPDETPHWPSLVLRESSAAAPR